MCEANSQTPPPSTLLSSYFRQQSPVLVRLLGLLDGQMRFCGEMFEENSNYRSILRDVLLRSLVKMIFKDLLASTS